jgi:hypothetical protein
LAESLTKDLEDPADAGDIDVRSKSDDEDDELMH